VYSSQATPISGGEGSAVLQPSLVPINCMFAHRRVACTARRGWGSAQVDDATDEIEEDREDREDRSDIIESGEDMEEADRANDDLLDEVGNGLVEEIEALGQAEVGHVSIVVLAILVLLICLIA